MFVLPVGPELSGGYHESDSNAGRKTTGDPIVRAGRSACAADASQRPKCRQADAGRLPTGAAKGLILHEGGSSHFCGRAARSLPLLQDRDLPRVVEVVLDDSLEQDVA